MLTIKIISFEKETFPSHNVLFFSFGVVFIAQGNVVKKAGITLGHYSITEKSFYLVPWKWLDNAWIVLHCVSNPTDTKRESR